MRIPLALCALAVLTTASAARAAPPTWVMDPAGSRLGFTAGFNGQAVKGVFKRWNAEIAFYPADLADSRILADVDTASASTGDATRDQALPTPDFFSSHLFPHATFRSRRIRAAGANHYVADGDLTLRNVTRPVSLAFDLAVNGTSAKASGGASLDRLVFNVGLGQWRSTEAIPAKVGVDLVLLAHRKP